MSSTSRHISTKHQLQVLCNKKFRQVCALRTAYSLAQWLNFHTLNLQYAKCPTQPAYYWCFPDDRVTSSCIFLQRAEDVNENLKTHLKTGTSSGHMVLNDLQWFILVTFKSIISKNEVHELGESRHPVNVLWTVYTHHEWEHSSVSKQKRKVTTDGFSECLHRQTSDQVLQTPRWTGGVTR